VQFIIRDFVTAQLQTHARMLEELAQKAVAAFPGSRVEINVTKQYRNMKEMLDAKPQVMQNAIEAYRRAGLNPVLMNIRGGTDGSRLSYMGMPCPNIFTGEMAIHSKQEYVSVQDMQKAVDVCVELVQVWEQQSSNE
jgi:tripeptide aminopeptidase